MQINRPQPIPDYFDVTGRQVYTGDVYSREYFPGPDVLNPEEYSKSYLVILWFPEEIAFGWLDIQDELPEYLQVQNLSELPIHLLQPELPTFFDEYTLYEGNLFTQPEKFKHLITA